MNITQNKGKLEVFIFLGFDIQNYVQYNIFECQNLKNVKGG